MSKYTTQLRWIVEQEQGNVPYSSNERYTEETWKKLGLSDYELFEPNYRSTLNAKIIDHFFFREIGFETAAQFAWYMRRTMQEIMPYYNKLYELQAEMTEPLRDWYRHGNKTGNENSEIESLTNEEYGGIDVNTDTKTGTETQVYDGCEAHNGTDVTQTQDNSSVNSRNVFQDTPMSMLNNTGEPQIENLDYATNVTYDDKTSIDTGTSSLTHGHGIDRDDTTTTTFNTTLTDTTDYGKTISQTGNETKTNNDSSTWDEYGLNTSQSKLLMEWKKAWVNVDKEIIEDLETLFLGLW